MPQPSTRSSAGSITQRVKPSVRPLAMARPLACHGYTAVATSRPDSLGFAKRQTGPGDFGIGEDDGRNGLRLERGGMAGEHFGRDFAFVRRFMREHRFAGHVADRHDVRVGRLPAAR